MDDGFRLLYISLFRWTGRFFLLLLFRFFLLVFFFFGVNMLGFDFNFLVFVLWMVLRFLIVRGLIFLNDFGIFDSSFFFLDIKFFRCLYLNLVFNSFKK